MNVVIAIDSFKGSLSSLEAGESAANVAARADNVVRVVCGIPVFYKGEKT